MVPLHGGVVAPPSNVRQRILTRPSPMAHRRSERMNLAIEHHGVFLSGTRLELRRDGALPRRGFGRAWVPRQQTGRQRFVSRRGVRLLAQTP